MRTIMFALALSSLLSLYHVEATGRSLTVEKVDPAIEQLCQNTDYPRECVSAVTSFISGPVEIHLAIKAGIKALESRTIKAIAEAQKCKSGKSGEETDQIDYAYLWYLCAEEHIDITKELSTRDYVKLKEELHTAFEAIDEIEYEEKKTPLSSVNEELHKVAKNNFDLLTNIVKPTGPPTAGDMEEDYEEEIASEEENH